MTTKIADDYLDIKEQLAKLEAEKAKERATPAAADVPAPELSYDAMYLHGMDCA